MKLTAQQRTALREKGYSDGYYERPKRSDNPEYLTSYRRGVEARPVKKPRPDYDPHVDWPERYTDGRPV